MIFLASFTGFALIFFLVLAFYLYKIEIDSGFLLGFFLFFDIYGFILSKIFPFITSLAFIVVIAIFSIIVSFLTKPKLFYNAFKQKEFLSFLSFFIFVLLSYLWTPNPKYGLYKIQIFLIKSVLPGIAIYFSYTTFKKLNWVPVIISGILYISIFFIFQQDSAYTTHRMTIEGANPIWIARAILMLVTITFFALKWPIPLKLFIIVPAVIAGFFAQSKGPFVALFIAIAFLYLKQYLNNHGEKSFFSLIMKIFFFSISVLLILNIVIEQTAILENSRFAVLFSVKKLFADPTFLDRIVKFGKAIKIFTHNIFFGSGIGGFAALDERHYPHNIFLELASELGLVGLFIWFNFIKHIFALGLKSKFLSFLFIQTFAYTFFSGDMGSNNEYIIVSFIIMAFFYNRHLKQRKM